MSKHPICLRALLIVGGMLFGLWFAVAARAQDRPSKPGVVRFDFETGDLQGWEVVEGGFDKLVCDREMFHHQTKVKYDKQGKYFLSTLERSNAAPDDQFTGVIESPVFVLRGPTASFLVGGGSHPDTYVALCTLDGKEVLKASGKNSQVMQRVAWDLSGLVGQKVFLRIVDRNIGGWGHVTFDDFAATGELDPAATAERNRARALAKMQEEVLPVIPSLRAAVQEMTQNYGGSYAKGKEYLARLANIEQRLKTQRSFEQLDVLKAELLGLQREALVANPLLRAHPILFVVRPQYTPDHHNTETMFQTGEINTKSFRGGGALKVLDLAAGEAKTLLEAPEGIIRDPDVYFDGKKILFSMRKDIADDYHIYEIHADGSGLRQLTFGSGLTDIDPLYLPDDRIAFTSTREPKYCMCNRHIMGNLFRMEADGANITQIGKSTLFEGHGTLTPDGQILYDRWEYVDRNFGDAQGLWTCNPDGTNHAIYWGNNTKSPGAVIDARIIPGTQQCITVFGSCHDRPWGALALVDRRLGLDGRGPVVRTWPAGAINTVDLGWGKQGYQFDSYKSLKVKYEDPYPLNDPSTPLGAGKYFLCSRMTGAGERMGIYLLDVFGNEALVNVEGPGCYDPMPLAPRPRPPVIPDRVKLDQREGYVYVYDVYNGTGMERVERGSVKSLRVVESPEKRFWSPGAWNGQGQEAPAMNWNDFNNKCILGAVPVEPDGSAYFAVPPDRFIFFQLLDQDGMMIQTMRSGTIVRPGETLGCIGCHDNRLTGVPNHAKAAVSRAPSRLKEWYGPPRDYSYTVEVQPVFDKYCVSCHEFGKPGAKKVVLAGDRTLAFNFSYNELWRKGIIKAVGAGPADILPPYTWGSHASKLTEVIRKGHNNVRLDPESLDRLITWMDINAPYYSSYATNYQSNLYGRSPLDGAQLKRLTELTGVEFQGKTTNHHLAEIQVNFTRPELSLCLEKFADKKDPTYKEALAIIQAGKASLAEKTRSDMPGFVLLGIEAQRQARYEERARIEAEMRLAILRGEKKYPYKPNGSAQ